MVLLRNKEILKIKNIFDNINSKYNLKLNLDEKTIKPNCLGRYINIDEENNPIYRYLNERAPSRKESSSKYYHYKSVDIAKQILDKQTIQVSNAISNSDNDFSEFSEFFRRTGMINPFTSDSPIEKGFFYDSSGRQKIDIWKENMFILCFTDSYKNDRFWKEYSGSWNQVCLELSLEFPHDADSWKLNFKNIAYDSGNDFDFILELNEKLRKSLQIEFSPLGWIKFAMHYKRNKYSWENETRLSFYFEGPTNMSQIYPVKTDNKRKYIEIGSNSKNVKWLISRVICGPLVSSKDMNELDRLGKIHNANIRIERY